jgi:hypothetical protein
VITLPIEHPINQGAPGLAHLKLGNNPNDASPAMKNVGCLVSALVEAYRFLTKTELAVEDALHLFRAQRCFAGAGLLWERACDCLLLDTDILDFDFDGFRRAVDAGRPVVLGIDYKPGRSSGYSNTDHFVLGIGYDGDDVVVFADPNGGVVGRMQIPVGTYRKKYASHEGAKFAEMRTLALRT